MFSGPRRLPSQGPVKLYCQQCDETYEHPFFIASHRAWNGDTHPLEAQMEIYTEDPFDIPSRRENGQNQE